MKGRRLAAYVTGFELTVLPLERNSDPDNVCTGHGQTSDPKAGQLLRAAAPSHLLRAPLPRVATPLPGLVQRVTDVCTGP